jgi:hypothetical protein
VDKTELEITKMNEIQYDIVIALLLSLNHMKNLKLRIIRINIDMALLENTKIGINSIL